jgi:release factor glutamine methyltransferase
MKIKEYRSQFIQELLSAYDAGEAEFFLSDTRREASVKRIDLALDPELIFSEGELSGILS